MVRRWRLLLAHDASAPTCNPLVDSIEGALGNVDLYESSSIDDARDATRSSLMPAEPEGARFDVCLVCLDLPPAPGAGARLAEELLDRDLRVILVTRSLRWLPASAGALRELPWVTPDATVGDVASAVRDAMAAQPTAGPSQPRLVALR